MNTETFEAGSCDAQMPDPFDPGCDPNYKPEPVTIHFTRLFTTEIMKDVKTDAQFKRFLNSHKFLYIEKTRGQIIITGIAAADDPNAFSIHA